MHILDDTGPRSTGGRSGATYVFSMVAASLASLVTTFLLADSDMGLVSKTAGFSAIVVSFLGVSALLYLLESKRTGLDPGKPECQDEFTDRHLGALADANEFFAGLLKQADAFRLVASRIRPLLPYRSIELLLVNEARLLFSIVESGGEGSEGRRGLVLNFEDGLAARSYYSQQAEFGNESISPSGDICSSAAIPLRDGGAVYGVIQLYFDQASRPNVIDPLICESISVRIAPLIQSSIAFENSQTNALIDATTDLPNERAFYLVLENQIAEAIRMGGDRPLTILAMDVKEFEDINRRFGHAAGDRVLNHVARRVQDNLRQMDFFSRTVADEFLAILPTASTEISHDIIARIRTAFFGTKLELTEADSIEIDVNIGWAEFGSDGETAAQLLLATRLRKEQAKNAGSGKVLWFSKELVI